MADDKAENPEGGDEEEEDLFKADDDDDDTGDADGKAEAVQQPETQTPGEAGESKTTTAVELTAESASGEGSEPATETTGTAETAAISDTKEDKPVTLSTDTPIPRVSAPAPAPSGNGGKYGLPADIVVPASVTPSLLQGKLLETLRALPKQLISDALVEYDDAVQIKGESIRNRGAYLYGVVKRYVSVQERANSGEGADILPMGPDLTPAVNGRLAKLVQDRFCTQEEMNDKVKSKIRMLSEKDALFAIEELASVDRGQIRNFGSYFMGILNRYMRGERKDVTSGKKTLAEVRQSFQQQNSPHNMQRRDDRFQQRGRDSEPQYRGRPRDDSNRRDRSRDRSDNMGGGRRDSRDFQDPYDTRNQQQHNQHRQQRPPFGYGQPPPMGGNHHPPPPPPRGPPGMPGGLNPYQQPPPSYGGQNPAPQMHPPYGQQAPPPHMNNQYASPSMGGPPPGNQYGAGGPPPGNQYGNGGPPGNQYGNGGPPGNQYGNGGPPPGNQYGTGGPPPGNQYGTGGPPPGNQYGSQYPPPQRGPMMGDQPYGQPQHIVPQQNPYGNSEHNGVPGLPPLQGGSSNSYGMPSKQQAPPYMNHQQQQQQQTPQQQSYSTSTSPYSPPAAQNRYSQPVGPPDRWGNQGGMPPQSPAAAVDILALADKASSAVQALQNQNKFQMPPHQMAQQQQPPQSPYGAPQQPYGQPQMNAPPPYQQPMNHQPYGQPPMQVPPQNPNQGGFGGQKRRRTTATIAELPITVQYAVQNLQATGEINGPLDDGMLGMVKDLPESLALQALEKFCAIDKATMRNKTAYLAGVLRRELEKIHKR